MRREIAIAGLFAGLISITTGTAAAQDTTTPTTAPPSATNPANPPRKALKKPTQPQDAVPDAPAPAPDAAPDSASNADTPAADQRTPPATTGKRHSTAEDNPFPEDYSKAAEKAPDKDSAPDAPASGSSPAPQPGQAPAATGGSSSQEGLDKLDLYGDKQKKRGSDPNAGLAYDPKLAAQDDKIGEFYLKNGNAPGAYSRFKDATQHDAGDANAVFGLAEAARQLNLLDEAAQQYQTYLFAFPDGAKARLAKKALAELKLKEKH